MSCRGVECFGRPNEAEPRETSARARERASTAQHRVTAYAHSVSVFYILTRTHTTSVLKRSPLQSRDHDQGALGGTHKAYTACGRCAAAHTCCLFTRHAPRPRGPVRGPGQAPGAGRCTLFAGIRRAGTPGVRSPRSPVGAGTPGVRWPLHVRSSHMSCLTVHARARPQTLFCVCVNLAFSVSFGLSLLSPACRWRATFRVRARAL